MKPGASSRSRVSPADGMAGRSRKAGGGGGGSRAVDRPGLEGRAASKPSKKSAETKQKRAGAVSPAQDASSPSPLIVNPSLGLAPAYTSKIAGDYDLKMVAGGGAPSTRMSVLPATSTRRAGSVADAGGSRWSPGRSLKVVHVGPCLYRGGAEIWLQQALRFFDPAQVQVTKTIATEPHLIDPDFSAEIPIPVEVGRGEAIRQAAAECDVLLCWGVALDELLGKHGRKLPCACVGIAHGEGWFTRQQLEQSRHYLDHVIAVSEAARQGACHGLGVPTSVVSNGVDTARLAWTGPRDDMRRSLGFATQDFVVGYVGRLSPEKRVSLVLDALGELPASYKGLIVGWGPLLPTLLDRANRELPGRCVIRTATDYLGDYYRAMDAFCSPSESEGTPLTMLEAMFSGVPVLMTEVGAVPELIENRINGIVVQPEASDIQNALERLRRYPKWAAGLAEEGRRTADEQGHASRMAKGYEDVMAQVWAARHG